MAKGRTEPAAVPSPARPGGADRGEEVEDPLFEHHAPPPVLPLSGGRPAPTMYGMSEEYSKPILII